jgi:hypothetical protein
MGFQWIGHYGTDRLPDGRNQWGAPRATRADPTFLWINPSGPLRAANVADRAANPLFRRCLS